MTATEQESHTGIHLVVLHHGLWGHAGHVKFIANEFKKRLGDRLVIYRARANESELTYDGIDICGQRFMKELYEVIKTIESGGDIEDLRGKKKKKTTSNDNEVKKAADTTSQSASSSKSNSTQDVPSTVQGEEDTTTKAPTTTTKKVTQFSYLGYSLGGLIGRFAMGLLAEDGFFEKVEPVYFVTMATPHLGIRQPPLTNFSKVFNYLSSRMLSRTGEQLQLIDDYIDGRPMLLVMSEPSGIFMQALARFKRRAVYCNIKNDRSVPFWTASFSDADPFSELDMVDIQYSAGYSSLIESFQHRDLETVARLEEERRAALQAASFKERATHTLKSIPWKKYAFFGLLGPILIPIWIVFASSTISVQGYNSRRRTKDLVHKIEDLEKIRQKASTVSLSGTLTSQEVSDPVKSDDHSSHASVTSDVVVKSANASEHRSHDATASIVESVTDSEPASFSYPDLKTIRPLALAPVQVEISRNLNQLVWKKYIIHIEGLNAHASIVVREKRFSNDGGVAAVQHAVDMFKDDGEDE
ncbi:hypothetical protein BGZ94_007075 [Podila epigama]|nr:hypothetical protein BGZ94_007075 [Podila epigama]